MLPRHTDQYMVTRGTYCRAKPLIRFELHLLSSGTFSVICDNTDKKEEGNEEGGDINEMHHVIIITKNHMQHYESNIHGLNIKPS